MELRGARRGWRWWWWRGGWLGKSDQGVESRAKRMSKVLRDHRKEANFEDGKGETVQGIRSVNS